MQETLFAVQSQFWYAMFAILNLVPGIILGTGGFQHTVVNTPFVLKISVDYRSAFVEMRTAIYFSRDSGERLVQVSVWLPVLLRR